MSAADPFRAIPGEMAGRVRAFDWTKTPLGPITGWPQSLKTAVSMVLLSPVPIVMLWGEDGIMIYNDAYSVFAGGRHPTLLGSKVREGWPEVADFNDNVMKVGLAGGTLAYRDQELTLHRTGKPEPVWMNLDYSPILDESGNPAGVMAIVVETTERVLAERKVRQEHARLAQMFAQAPSFMAQLDGPEHIYTLTNGAYQRLIGHRPVLGKTIREALPELDGQGFFELLDQVYRTGTPYVGRSEPVSLQAGPGEPYEHVLLDFVYQPIKAADGSVTGIFVEGVDVTEQRAAENALRRSEEHLRLATENAGIALWDIDAEGGIHMAYSRDSSPFVMDQDHRVPFQHLLDNLHQDDATKLQLAYDAARDPAKRPMMDVEYRVLPTETSPMRWVKVRGRGVFDANGNCLRVSGTALDITALKQSQAREAVLVELADRFRSLEEPEDLAFAAAEILGRALNVSRAGYGTIDPRLETIVIERDWNAPGIQSLAGTLQFRDYGSYIEDLKRGITVVITDAREDERTASTAAALEAISARSFVNMPVTEQAGFVALLYLNHEDARIWTDDELELIREIAERTRVAVERRRVEKALARSEEQLRLATENAEIGMWDLDVVNNVNYSSATVKAMFGIPVEENPPSEEYFALVHTDDIARVTAAYRSAFDPGARESYNVQYRVIGRDDGVERWVHARGRGVFDDNGVCIRVTGTAMDITKERQTQEALRRSEELLRLATGHAEIGLWDVDNVANTLTWTKPVREAFGISHDNAVTLDDFYSGLHPDDLEKTSAAFSSAMDPNKRALYDVEYRTIGQEDGVERWVHAKGRGLFDDGGRCLRVVGTTIDVTARKRIEAELHELNETLEKRVAERTAALEKTQAALQQAQKMEAIGNLTGGIAHDFNNLLQGLTGSLDLIRMKPQDTERVRRYAEAGLQAAERGAKLTAQLLAFSRAQKLELKPLAMNTLLQDMRDLLGRTLGPSVQVTMDLGSDVGSVLGDETQLEMSVLNLAINARDAMPDGGALIILSRALHVIDDPELQPGDYVELRVSDNGSGMPPDVIARAFDPFFTTKGVGKGTGLGLSQVYGMAQQAGGTARIGSEPGKGTSVSIFLRATDGEAARKVKTDGARVNPPAEAASVLVIDDDPDVRTFLADSLAAFGYAVRDAKDGAQGLELLAQQKPDLLLVDYAMPGMTGAEVAARARKIHADLPIIFASGYAETAALENVQDANTAILRKPFRLGELQEAVSNALRR